MNIQFMTSEGNGIPTGEKNYRGEPRYRYIPNYDLMIANATCEEEIEAIRQCREILSRHNEGFAFEIVFTAIANSIDPKTCKMTKKWQVLQHPWYEYADTGIKLSKEEMLERIEKEFA